MQVPDLETYHAVAFEPLIGNKDAVHHMLLFGCDHDLGSFVRRFLVVDPHPSHTYTLLPVRSYNVII